MKIPVTRGFDKTDVIGYMVLQDDVKIPINSVFAFAYTIGKEKGVAQVREVSLIPDKEYDAIEEKHGHKRD